MEPLIALYIAVTAIFIPLSLFLCLLYVSENFRHLWFSWFYSDLLTAIVKKEADGVRAKLFERLSSVKTKERQLTILEIGPARGNNFEFYPPDTRVIALDCNGFFEKYYRENQANFPHIVCDEFITGDCQNMKEIADHSVDVVVATYLLCTVSDREKTLKEIKRVLKKGGSYFFTEHVGYPPTSVKHRLLLAIQLIMQPFWFPLLGGCRLHRQSWTHLENAGFATIEINFIYPKEILFFIRAQFWGIATTFDGKTSDTVIKIEK